MKVSVGQLLIATVFPASEAVARETTNARASVVYHLGA